LKRLSTLRKRIDEIDEQILRLLKERVDVCENIGVLKRERGVPVRDRDRENEQYTRIAGIASQLGLNPQDVRAVYDRIIAMCIRVQERESCRT